MRRLSDNHKIPREAQSYIIDSTGAPVCALLPFSTWAVFFAGLFYAEAGIPELGYGSAIDTFSHITPFTFSAIAAVIIVPPVRLWPDPQVGANAEGISASGRNRASFYHVFYYQKCRRSNYSAEYS